MKCPRVSFEVSMGLPQPYLGSLYFTAYGCVLALLENSMVCLALELVSSWVELGFSVGMEAFG